MFTLIENYCISLEAEFTKIPDIRRMALGRITEYIKTKMANNLDVNLLYVCTHNSRRSHFGQIWAKVASNYYGVQKVQTYSGGTEATEFNINAIHALIRIGFKVEPIQQGPNKKYHIWYDDKAEPMLCFSKVYNDTVNPKKHFVAIMTCGEAEKNCPIIPEVDLRIAVTYEDPKLFDETELRDLKYDERCKQIALETLYVFSNLKKK
jgi:arsenate reductase (thioredoxin)